MNISSTLSAYLEPYGIWWPEGDGDSLREVASAWQQMATLLANMATTLDGAADTLTSTNSGDAAAKFTTYWASWTGPNGYLALAENYCTRLANALDVFASDVDVADSQLTSVIEAALGPNALLTSIAGLPAISALPASRVASVANASDQIAASLGTAATEAPASAGVTTMAPLSLVSVAGGGSILLTQAEVSAFSPVIPDPGTAPDFSSLATTTIDFGNGSGNGNPSTLTAVGLAPTPAPAPAPAPAPLAPLVSASATPAHTTAAPIAKVPPLKPLGDTASPTPGASAGSFTPSPLPSGSLSHVNTSVPVSVPKPVSTSELPTAAKAAAGAVAAGALAAKAAKGASSSTIPFFPMGGMGGMSAMGDDTEDGRRRPRKV